MASLTKPACKYGAKCYRRNAQHLAQYSHPDQALPPPHNPSRHQAGVARPCQQAETGDQDPSGSTSESKATKRPATSSDDTGSDTGTVVEGGDPQKKRLRVDEYFKKNEPSGPAVPPGSTAQDACTDSDLDDESLVRLSESAERLAPTDPAAPRTTTTVTCSSASDSVLGVCMTDTSSASLPSTSTEGAEGAGAWAGDPKDVKGFILSHFLVDMPEDFYEFWEFAKSLNATNPSAVLVPTLKLQLVGPFDVLAGKFHSGRYAKGAGGRRPNCLLHYRYYYDPPEFMTVLKGDDESQFHMGYFRDDPKEMPVFIASNSAAVDCVIKPRADNLFAAVSQYTDEQLRGDIGPAARARLTALQGALGAWARSRGLPLEARSARMKAREKKVVTKSFHGAGVVVPIDKNDVGYRPLPESPADLKRILRQIVEGRSVEERDKGTEALAEIVTLVQFANDECDYGEGLELGLDLFSYGGAALHPTVRGLLPLAYQLLGRTAYQAVIEAHLGDRRRGPNVSQLD